jgi:hypothetical protein
MTDQSLRIQQFPIHPLDTLHELIIAAQANIPERRADYSAAS